MANVQTEKGYTPIANSILESLAKIRVSPEATRVLYVIFRLVYGYHKRSADISIKRFADMTGLWKPHICRALDRLTSMNIITKNDNETYAFQKDFDKWKPLPKMVTTVTNNGNESLPIMVTSVVRPKDTIKITTKDTTTKDTANRIFDHWNSQDIVKHEKLTNAISRKIQAKIKDYSIEKIIRSISNYNVVLKDPDCFWTFKWTLVDFLQKGIDKFMDIEIAKVNYKIKSIASSKVSSHHPHAAPGKYAHLGKDDAAEKPQEEIDYGEFAEEDSTKVI